MEKLEIPEGNCDKGACKYWASDIESGPYCTLYDCFLEYDRNWLAEDEIDDYVRCDACLSDHPHGAVITITNKEPPYSEGKEE